MQILLEIDVFSHKSKNAGMFPSENQGILLVMKLL